MEIGNLTRNNRGIDKTKYTARNTTQPFLGKNQIIILHYCSYES